MIVDAEARKALRIIRRCVTAGRYRVKTHFMKRMDERGLFWLEVVAVIESPVDVRDGGPEQWGRPKWVIGEMAADGLPIELVCVLDTDERGDATVFITFY